MFKTQGQTYFISSFHFILLNASTCAYIVNAHVCFGTCRRFKPDLLFI